MPRKISFDYFFCKMLQEMGRGSTVNIEKRSAINTLRGEGYSVRDIANKLKIPRSTVMYTIQMLKNTRTK